MIFDTNTDGGMPSSFAYQINKCSNEDVDIVSAGIANVTFSGSASDYNTLDIAAQIWSKGEVETYTFNSGFLIVPDG